MSLTNTTNNIYNVTLDGLTTIDADVINVGGQNLDPASYVTYNNATQDVDLGFRKISSMDTNPSTYNLINKAYLDNQLINYYTISQSDNKFATVTGISSLVSTQTLTSTLLSYDTSTTANSKFLTITGASGIYATQTQLSNINISDFFSKSTIGDQIIKSNILMQNDTPFIDMGDSTLGYMRFQIYGGAAASLRFGADLMFIRNTQFGPTTVFQLEQENVKLNQLTPNKVLIIDGNKYIVSSSCDSTKLSFLSNITSDIQQQFNNISTTLPSFLSITGASQIYATKTSTSNLVSASTLTSTLSSYLTSASAASTYATITTVNNKADKSYVDTQDASLQSQINNKANTSYVDSQDGLRVLKSGDTMTGDLTLSGTGTSSGVLAKRYYLTARSDNQDEKAGDEKFGPWYGIGDSGISGFTGKPCLAGYSGCALRSGLGYLALSEYGGVGINTINDLDIYKLNVDGTTLLNGDVTSGTHYITTDNYLNCGNGNNDGSESTKTQIAFGWHGKSNGYRHRITSEHQGGDGPTGNGNSLNFYLWSEDDEVQDMGTNHRMTIAGKGVGIGTTDPQCSLYNYGAGTSGWKGMSYFGNENTGIVAGTYNNMPYLGGHNGALNAWTNIRLQPGGGNCAVGDGEPTVKLDVFGQHRIYNNGGEDFLRLYNANYSVSQYINIRFNHADTRSCYIQSQLPGGNRAFLQFYTPDSAGNVGNRFRIQDDWTVVSNGLYLESNMYMASNPITTNTPYNNTSARLMFRETDGFVRHGDCSTWSYRNSAVAWTGGLAMNNAVYRVSSSSDIRLNIQVSWWATSGGNKYLNVEAWSGNASIFSGYRVKLYDFQKYFNITGNHETFTVPITFSRADLGYNTGWFSFLIYASGGGITSDVNDTVYWTAQVLG